MKNKLIIVLLLIVATASVTQAYTEPDLTVDVQIMPQTINVENYEPMTATVEFTPLGYGQLIDLSSIKLSWLGGYVRPELNPITGLVDTDGDGLLELNLLINGKELIKNLRRDGLLKGIEKEYEPVDFELTGQIINIYDPQNLQIFGGTATVVFYKADL